MSLYGSLASPQSRTSFAQRRPARSIFSNHSSKRASATCHRLPFSGGHEKWGYPVDNLFAEWDGDEALGHLCFIGHVDVVAPGDLRLWTCDPFGGEVRDGFLWGRGATDMKGAVAAFCAAAAGFAKSANGARPKISAIITTDEEWAAVNGTRKVLEWMRANGREPTAVLCGEPSSPSRFGTHIKVGRRGSLCGTIKAEGVQGHAAYPDLFENPNRGLALALAVLNAQRWDDELPFMPATAFEPVALTSGDFQATAIIPGEAEALWNIRFTPAQTVDALLGKLRESLDTLPEWAIAHPDAAYLKQITINANISTVSMPYYSPPSRFAELVSQTVSSMMGAAPIVDARGGTTDARFVPLFFPRAEIVELGLPENGGEGEGVQARGGMHQADERCSLSDLSALTECYFQLISRFGQQT